MQSPSQRFNTQLFKFEHALREQWSVESPSTPDHLSTYQNNWQNCFQSNYLGATEHEMMRVIAHSTCVIVSDFHPLKRSRQDFSFIVEQMSQRQPVGVVLELLDEKTMIAEGSAIHEEILLVNGSTLQQSYPRLFNDSKQANFNIYGAWIDDTPQRRDRHCAEIIKKLRDQNQQCSFALHFGDWHLADAHLPDKLQRLGIESTNIHLSPAPLWDDLSKRNLDDVIKFSDNKWAWMRTPPLAHAAAFLLDFGSTEDDDYAEELSYLVEDAACHLAKVLAVEHPQSAFEVMPPNDWDSFKQTLDNQQQFSGKPKAPVFHPRLPLMYIPGEIDANQIIQAAAHLIYCEHLSAGGELCQQFRSATLRNLCNIVLNPFYTLQDTLGIGDYQQIQICAFRYAKSMGQNNDQSLRQLFHNLKQPRLGGYELQLLRDTIEVA
ncbi:MAG: hypothetical protein H8E25_16650 [Planctomycetes bacterium]|nr:hypothetical protein [Planctomycetota bacterium]